jgi:hypothetical protein
MLLCGQRTGLAQARVALDLRCRGTPGIPLFLRQRVILAPRF